MKQPKILHLDVETKPATALVWRGYKENISPEQVLKPDGIICWAAKWHGQKTMKFGAKWKDKNFLKKLRDLIEQADMVVTYNGDKFDLPKINGALVRARLPPLPPTTSVDLYRAVRRLGFFSGKLAFVAPLLGLGSKIKHHGFSLWKEVMEGNPTSQRLMERYNKQDVKLLEELYTTLRPYLVKHPHVWGGHACSKCGSTHVQKRGHRITKVYQIERLQCQTCGGWDDGRKTKRV